MGLPSMSCCCPGGCNGWWFDGEPSSGFEGHELDGSVKLSCNRLDDCDGDGVTETETACGCDNDPQDSECCGPAVPTEIRISSSVFWDFGWWRDKQGNSCQGNNAPTDPPSVTYDCADQNLTVWEHDQGGWSTVQGGGITGLVLELQNASADPDDQQVGAGCCTKYYFGSVALDGPTAPAVTTNPWGFDPTNWTAYDAYGAPPKLRAYGRLVMMFRGEGPNGMVPPVQPRVTLLQKLDVIIGLDGYGDTWQQAIGANGLNEGFRTHPVSLYNSTSVNVTGCNCNGIGTVGDPATDDTLVHVLDTVDWSNNVKVAGQSYWHFAWPHANDPDSIGQSVYGDTCGGIPRLPCGPCNCVSGASGCCVTETHNLAAFSGCSDPVYSLCTGGCASPEPWWLPAHFTEGNWSCKRPATYFWCTNEDLGWGTQGVYSNQPAIANNNTSWQCYDATSNDPCGDLGTDAGQTSRIQGGFQGGFDTDFFPDCGLRDFQITYPGFPGVENPE